MLPKLVPGVILGLAYGIVCTTRPRQARPDRPWPLSWGIISVINCMLTRRLRLTARVATGSVESATSSGHRRRRRLDETLLYNHSLAACR